MRALLDISTVDAVAEIPNGAHAVERSDSVGARRSRRAASQTVALVQVEALHAITGETAVADAFERPGEVQAVCYGSTVVSSLHAFVESVAELAATGLARTPATVTCARKRPVQILAVAMNAAVGHPHVTLVDVNAAEGIRLKPIGTVQLVKTNATNGGVATEARFTLAVERASRVHTDRVVSLAAINAGGTFVINRAGTVAYAGCFIPHGACAVERPYSVDAARP